MVFLIIFTVLVALGTIVVRHLNGDYYVLALCRRIKTNDGSRLDSKVRTMRGKTIFGNNLDIMEFSSAALFAFLRNNCKIVQNKSYLLHFAMTPVYNVCNAEDAEAVLQSQSLITKGVLYNLMRGFLGEGLLTSTDKKWHFRRKILTPSFHFNILQSFLEIFKEECLVLLETLERSDDQTVALVDIVPQFTLNNICETALGVRLDDVDGSKEYRHAIHEMERIIVRRSCNPFMFNPWLFRHFGEYPLHEQMLHVVHEFSSKIIEKKRIEYKLRQQTTAEEASVDDFGKRKRYAMLDTLLAAEALGDIDHAGICDEVNTFMFEGYDTTSTCLMFALFNLALHPDVQAKCFKEIEQLDDITRLSVFDYNRLEYLECVIKETLRLYPSVPFISRQAVTAVEINGLVLPKSAQVNIHIYDIMRDPRHFPQPQRFDPERFLPQHTTTRQPFAFVPFSAGPRNCIGQKFAMLEIKVLLCAIIGHFELLPVTPLEALAFENGLVLRATPAIKLRLIKRRK